MTERQWPVAQIRVHNLNLWMDKDGNPKGSRPDAALMDAPWVVHLPKLILWFAAEALKAATITLLINRSGSL